MPYRYLEAMRRVGSRPLICIGQLQFDHNRLLRVAHDHLL